MSRQHLRTILGSTYEDKKGQSREKNKVRSQEAISGSCDLWGEGHVVEVGDIWSFYLTRLITARSVLFL